MMAARIKRLPKTVNKIKIANAMALIASPTFITERRSSSPLLTVDLTMSFAEDIIVDEMVGSSGAMKFAALQTAVFGRFSLLAS